MQDPTSPLLLPWANFYVIVGSSGAALTGLQFVVIALIAETRRSSSSETIGAFGTPTVVHFCAVLAIAGTLTAPFHTLTGPAIVLGICGVAGLVYIATILFRARRQTDYRPVLEDWIWHTALPFLGYGTLLPSAVAMARGSDVALFAVAATSVLLLFIGIHNAWDTVTYVVAVQPGAQAAKAADPSPVRAPEP